MIGADYKHTENKNLKIAESPQGFFHSRYILLFIISF